jgi:hypothetical protein
LNAAVLRRTRYKDNRTFSLAITTPSSTSISYASRESGANAPQLVIETQ